MSLLFYCPQSGRPGSNRPPSAWKADALPNELLPLITVYFFLKSYDPHYLNSEQPSVKPSQLSPKRILWGEKDSNLRSRKTTDLQSVPFGHSGISPYLPNFQASTGRLLPYDSEEPMEGFEPPTH